MPYRHHRKRVIECPHRCKDRRRRTIIHHRIVVEGAVRLDVAHPGAGHPAERVERAEDLEEGGFAAAAGAPQVHRRLAGLKIPKHLHRPLVAQGDEGVEIRGCGQPDVQRQLPQGSASVELAVEVQRLGAPQQDQQDRTGRQCNQHPDESQQLPEGQQGEDDGQGTQADALAHPARRQHEALQQLTKQRAILDERVGIVVYNETARVVLRSTSGDRKQEIIDAIESLQANGSTNGTAAHESAPAEAAPAAESAAVNETVNAFLAIQPAEEFSESFMAFWGPDAQTATAFVKNFEDARAAGMKVGAVHRYDPCQPAERQSANFVTVVPRDPAMLPAAVWLDQLADDCPIKVGDAAVESELTTFLNQIETHTGKAAVLKISRRFERRYKIAARVDRNVWLEQLRFAPDYAGRPWALWTANDRLVTEALEGGVRWVVVQP